MTTLQERVHARLSELEDWYRKGTGEPLKWTFWDDNEPLAAAGIWMGPKGTRRRLRLTSPSC
jgi:hypothetical protein